MHVFGAYIFKWENPYGGSPARRRTPPVGVWHPWSFVLQYWAPEAPGMVGVQSSGATAPVMSVDADEMNWLFWDTSQPSRSRFKDICLYPQFTSKHRKGSQYIWAEPGGLISPGHEHPGLKKVKMGSSGKCNVLCDFLATPWIQQRCCHWWALEETGQPFLLKGKYLPFKAQEAGGQLVH